MSDIYNPVTLSSLRFEGDANSMQEFYFKKRIFVVAAGFSGLYIVNFTDLYNPNIISHARCIKSSLTKVDIRTDDKYAFATEIFTGLLIYDV